MKKLVFIHTAPDIINRLNKKLNEKFKDISIENLMDDSLSKLLKKDRSRAIERLNTLIQLAEEDSDSEDVEIVITCTALSELSNDTYRNTTMIDSYLHKEVARYNNILLVATTEGALLPTKKGIINNIMKGEPVIDEIFVNGAREEFKRGNKDIHDKMVKYEVKKKLSDKNYDVVVLCQPSMAHLKNEIESQTGLKVLTGIDYFIENYKYS